MYTLIWFIVLPLGSFSSGASIAHAYTIFGDEAHTGAWW